MRTIALFIGSFVWTLFHVASAQCLEFSMHENNKSKTLTAILATGAIEEGDEARLQALLHRLTLKKYIAVYLASPGGDLYEGMRLGLYFHRHRIRTVVEGGYNCASACALAFLGGTNIDGRPWRSSSTDSRLGFHAFKGITEEAIDTNEAQRIVADILRYGKKVNAPIDLLIAGFSTPSKDIFWVSHSDVCALGIKLWSNDTDRFVCNE